MAVRASGRVEVGIIEFIRLSFLMLACHENEYDIGDCGLVESAPDMFADIQKNSKITLTMDQLDSLIFHYKQAILHKVGLGGAIKALPSEYQSLMKKIQAYIPDKVRRNKYGELVLVGYNHRFAESRARRESFRKKIREVETDDESLNNPNSLPPTRLP